MSAQAHETGRRFGKYELSSLLARGGMGEVYLASLHGELGFEKKLVIKTIRPELASRPRFVDLFAAEARTAVALTHGNIVPIYELGRSGDTLYIAMGHVDGPSVAQLLQRHRELGRPVDLAPALFVVREMACGLAYAHTREADRPAVVHRDISPRNVLLDRSGQVRIVDFGIALPAEVSVQVGAGSSGYMAPEQARAAAADPSADVFSTACVLYELLTLERAFPREGVWTAPDLERVPAPLRSLIGRSLALDPAQRPPDAAVFLRELSALAAELAPPYTSHDLAGHLPELFPRGFGRDAGERVGATPATPITGHTETFATRLTVVREEALAPAAEGPPPPSHVPVGATGRGRTRSIAAVGALAGIVGVALWLAREDAPAASPPAELPSPEPPPASARPPAAALPSPPLPFLLRVSPANAKVVVSIDGETAPGPPYLLSPPAEGSRRVAVAAPGFHETRLELFPADGGRTSELSLVEKQLGQLDVVAPGVAYADVFIDGKKQRGPTPRLGIALEEGEHHVVVRCPAQVCGEARKLADERVTVAAGKTARVEAGG